MDGEHTLELSREAWMVFRDFRRWLQPMIMRSPQRTARRRLLPYPGLLRPSLRLLHYLIEQAAIVEPGTGKIGEKQMLSAAALCRWHVHEIDRLLSIRHESEDQFFVKRIVDRIEKLPGREISMRNLQRMLTHKSMGVKKPNRWRKW